MTSTLALELTSRISETESQQRTELKAFRNLSIMYCWRTSFSSMAQLLLILLQKFLQEFVLYGQHKDSIDDVVSHPRVAL